MCIYVSTFFDSTRFILLLFTFADNYKMTRTATKPGRKKRALDATPWSELSTTQEDKSGDKTKPGGAGAAQLKKEC